MSIIGKSRLHWKIKSQALAKPIDIELFLMNSLVSPTKILSLFFLKEHT